MLGIIIYQSLGIIFNDLIDKLNNLDIREKDKENAKSSLSKV